MSRREMAFHPVKRPARKWSGPAEQASALRARALERAFSLLKVPVGGGSELGVAELSEQAHLSHSVMHRPFVILEESRKGFGKTGAGITVDAIDASADPHSPATFLCQEFNYTETLSIHAIRNFRPLRASSSASMATLCRQNLKEHP